MIKAIFFDWGGVFTRNADLKEFCQIYADKHDLDFTIFSNKMIELWYSARVGKIDSEIFWSELGSMADVAPEQMKADLNNFSGFEMANLDFVNNSLKGKYNLGIISNHIESWFEPLIVKYSLKSIFDSIITSYVAHYAKPAEQIYKCALEDLQVKPEESIFIDDLEKNIPVAISLGFETILYKNLTQLKDELRELGVNY